MKIQDKHIAFIGAGNMATALIQGLLARGLPCANIWASDPDEAKLERLSNELGINATTKNEEAVEHADIVILAVKPQLIKAVLAPLQQTLNSWPVLIISIAAGITTESLEKLIAQDQSIIRCMPNTPALVQAGASALFANTNCSEADKAVAEKILEAVGTVCWLEQEDDMHTVTALSGSGPAYFFLFIEALRDAAIQRGLAADLADALAKQTALGAAKLALQSDDGVDILRQKVTSPGGTTEAAITQLEKDAFRAIIARAIAQARSRSEELAQQATQ
jgi:pyrroline-5-carboxylate reductase